MFRRRLIGFDTETHLIVPGRLAPPVVCLTLAGAGEVPETVLEVFDDHYDDVVIDLVRPGTGGRLDDDAGEWSALVTSPPVIARLWGGLVDLARLAADHEDAAALVGFNTPFDLAVLVDNALRFYPAGGLVDPLAQVFDALEHGTGRNAATELGDPSRCTIRDVRIREQLLAIEAGWFDFDFLVTQRKPKFSLAEVVFRRFGIDLSAEKTDPNAWRLRYAELANVPARQWPAGAKAYAVDDAKWTVRAAIDQAAGAPVTGGAGAILVDEFGNVTDECDQIRAAWALHLISTWGLRTDPKASATWEAMVRGKVADSEAIALRAGIVKVKRTWFTRGVCRSCSYEATTAERDALTCPACGNASELGRDMSKFRGVVERAYAARGGVAPATDGGATATDRATLIASGDPDLKAFAELGVYSKNLSTHVPRLAGGFKHAVTYGINVLVRSGRTSSSTHQPPRGGGFRECHVPRRGWLYCSVDYDIAELKGLAQVHLNWFRQSALADAINSGEDPHLSFAVDLLNRNSHDGAARPPHGGAWTYADVKAVPKDKAHPLYEAVHGAKGARQLAKIANFGFPGGLGAIAFVEYARGYGVDLEAYEGEDLRSAWLEKWREMPAYFNTIGAACESGSFTLLQLASGRQRGGCGFTQACNGYFQGLVADFAKRATWEVQRAAWGDPSSIMYGIRPVLFVHDEIFFEVPAPWAYPDLDDETRRELSAWSHERTSDACDEVARLMCEVAQRYTPDVRITASPALMRRWYKGADTVRELGPPIDGLTCRRSLLVPWEPTAAAPKVPVVKPPVTKEDLEDAAEVRL